MRKARVGVDVGGTFTDFVALAGDSIVTAKVPSTPRDQSEGVMNAIGIAGIDASAVTFFAHGMTVATNALLERKGAHTALVTTSGFRDVLEIARQNRPSLYDLTQDRPPALVPRELRFTVKERMGPEGRLARLEESSVDAAVAGAEEAQVQAVAVCLLFSFLHPEHERRVGERLRKALPGVRVSLSHEVLPEFREYERFSTTTADAYLAPGLAAYLERLEEKVRSAGMPTPVVMQSSGGVLEVQAAARRAAACVLSGPAAGVVGAAYAASASGSNDVLTFDMGGTSTDVAPVIDGRVASTTEAVIAGIPIKFPMVDVHTVSAGGGSVAWVDEGGALRVGPRSAGADPGPAAYAKGGEDATVTDANLFLGYLANGARLGGAVVLRREPAEKALDGIGRELGMDAVEVALGVVRVANAEMVRALRVISVERGLDPRDFALVAFGGAGPMHACALAEELGIKRVLVPKASGVLSALGLAVSDLRRDYVSPFMGELASADLQELRASFEKLEAGACKELETPQFHREADLRYKGQSFEVTVDADDLETVQELEGRFHDAHARRYGYEMQEETVEVVSLRLTATVPAEKPPLVEEPSSEDPRAAARVANFDGDWSQIDVLDRTRLGAGSEVEGPAIVEFPEATCVIRPGWRGLVDGAGALVLERV